MVRVRIRVTVRVSLWFSCEQRAGGPSRGEAHGWSAGRAAGGGRRAVARRVQGGGAGPGRVPTYYGTTYYGTTYLLRAWYSRAASEFAGELGLGSHSSDWIDVRIAEMS